MSALRDFDLLLRSWLDESAPSRQPDGLLEAVLETTSRSRQRPAWLVRLGGEPMLEPGRSGLNRIAPLAMGATVLVVGLLIGISLLVRPPDVGPPATPPPPDPSPSPASVGDSPFVRGSRWEIVSVDATAIPPPSAEDRFYLDFFDHADRVVFDPGLCDLVLAVSHDPHGSAIRFDPQGPTPLCGTVEYVSVVRQTVVALESVERWQPAGEAFDLIGSSTIRVRFAVDAETSCVPPELVGTYVREVSAVDTDDSTLHGAWRLSLGACEYVLAVDGVDQVGGRLELIEGDSNSARLVMSEDVGCDNTGGEGNYAFTLAGSTLTIEEAIPGSDGCQGRAAALVGTPGWSR